MNRSVKDALVAEEKFFRSRPVQSYCPLTDFPPGFHLQIVYLFIMLLQVYNGLADRCGITQLAKKLNQVEYLWHSCMSVSWNRVYSFRWFISEIWFYLVFFNMFLHCAYGLCGLLCLQRYKPFPLSSSLSYVSFSMWGLASFLVLLSLLEICTFVNFRPMLLINSTITFHLLRLINFYTDFSTTYQDSASWVEVAYELCAGFCCKGACKHWRNPRIKGMFYFYFLDCPYFTGDLYWMDWDFISCCEVSSVLCILGGELIKDCAAILKAEQWVDKVLVF